MKQTQTKHVIDLPTEEDTERLGRAFAKVANLGSIFFLQGQLGSGKTTFVRGFLRGLNYTGIVKSPTYALVEEYDLSGKIVYHFDLYRLEDPRELDYIGGREYFSPEAIVLLEWPELGFGVLPEPDFLLHFEVSNQGRKLEIISNSAPANRMLSEMKIEVKNTK